MPSYRVTMVIGAVVSGVAPDSLLPAARDAASTLVVVEAVDLGIVRGYARIVVRFTADDAGIASQVGLHVTSVVTQLATVESWLVTERDGARWNPVRTSP